MELLAVTDTLTGLANRRQFDAYLDREMAHSRRHKNSFCLLMIDADHFKRVNDQFGHRRGDEVLAHLAQTIEGSLRADDCAFRVGGEEFAVLWRDAGEISGLGAAERLLAAVRRDPFRSGNDVHDLTVSIGVSALTPRAEVSRELLVARSDAALYAANGGGRDLASVDFSTLSERIASV